MLPQRLRALVPAGLALFLLAACSRGGPPTQDTAAPPVVTAGTVTTARWQDSIEALGTAQARESITLTAKVTEKVTRVNFEDGDTVEAGQVLVDLSGRAEVAELEAARATHAEAGKQYDRLVELAARGVVPRSQLDSQLATRDAAKARADAIRAALADRVISAPFAGVLGFRQVSPGALVTPGTVITTLDAIDTLKLDFPVPEAHFGHLEAGFEVVARSPAFPGEAFHGTVTAVGSRIDPASRAVTVRAVLDNPGLRLRPGMLLSVQLLQPPREALVVPEIAVVQVGGQSFLWKLDDDDRVSQIEVELGARRPGEVEVRRGMAAGERIVVEGTVKLREGMSVRIAGSGREQAGAPA